MYKLSFDDKPEANTYIKWASQKGYKVEGPFREKLAKNAKKFDLNGKPKKYGYVVIRKRGGAPGAGGGEVKEETPLYSTRGAAEHERSVRLGAGHKNVFVRPHHKKGWAGGVEGYSVESTPPERGAKTVKLQPSEPKTKATKGAAKALRDSLEKSATQETIHERLVRDAEKLKIGSKAPPEPKKRGRPPKAKTITAKKKPLLKGAVAVEEKPPERKSFAPGTFAMPETLRKTQYRSSPERISKAAGAVGISLTPEQIKASQRKVKGVIEEKVEKIAGETSRKPTDAEQVAADWEARGYTPEQIAASQKAFAKSEKELRDYYKETKLTEARRRPEGKKILGKTFVEAMAAEAVATEPETIEGKYWEETKLTKAQKEGKSWTGAMAREGRKVHEAAEKEGDRQTSARKKLEKKLKKEGIDPAKRLAGISDYTKELEKYEGAKIEAIGQKKVARAKAMAEREKKYEKTFASYEEAAKWGKGQRDVSKKEDVAEMKERAQRMAGVMGDKGMTPEQKRAEIGRLGKEFEEVAKAKQARGGVGAKRKSYVVRTKKGFKVITGTKEELETPTSLKAALAKEKRKFKKRKKLLEKPLREIKRAKKVLRTTSRHGAKMLLRKPSSLVPLRGHHPAIGNVSMEYHRARIATPVTASRSIAGTYTT